MVRENLKRARKDAGMTQQQVADEIWGESYMREEQNIIHLSATSEKELQREMNETVFASADVQYDNIFFVMPNEQEKTIMILPSTFGSVLKLGIKEAGILAEIIQNQIQEWKFGNIWKMG